MSDIEAKKILLAHVANADGQVREAEINTAIAMAKVSGIASDMTAKQVMFELKFLMRHRIETAIERLADSRFEARAKLVQLLWVMAVCDGELHASEEALIYRIADQLGVDRATVASQQPDL